MTSELAANALRMVTILRGRSAGSIVDSDSGGRFGSKMFAMMLGNNGIVESAGTTRRWRRSLP